jgi:FkbM family methyltransferase
MSAGKTILAALRERSRKGVWTNPRLRAGVARIVGSKRKSWLWGVLFDVLEGSYRVADMRFEIPRHLTTRSFRSRFFWDFYETQERDLVDRYVRPHDRVLELGGCIGVVACATNRKLSDPHGHVVVEANPALIPSLELNKSRNGCGFNVEHGMLSRSSDGTFYVHDDILDGSQKDRADAGGKAVRTTVPVTSIEAIEAKYRTSFNALIMDIEGGELAFLEENSGFLSRVDLVIVEFHAAVIGADGCARGRAILQNLGFMNVENIDNTEAWASSSRAGVDRLRTFEASTTAELPPPAPTLQGYEPAWDGVDGLVVRELPAVSGQAADRSLRLITTTSDGRHRLGLRFRLPAPGAYRVTARFNAECRTWLYLEIRDGIEANQGVAIYDPASVSVVEVQGKLLDAGIATEDRTTSVWGDLRYADAFGVVYIGMMSRHGEISYRGDGRSELRIFGLDVEGQPHV